MSKKKYISDEKLCKIVGAGKKKNKSNSKSNSSQSAQPYQITHEDYMAFFEANPHMKNTFTTRADLDNELRMWKSHSNR